MTRITMADLGPYEGDPRPLSEVLDELGVQAAPDELDDSLTPDHLNRSYDWIRKILGIVRPYLPSAKLLGSRGREMQAHYDDGIELMNELAQQLHVRKCRADNLPSSRKEDDAA